MSEDKKPSILELFKSMFGSFFGVQSKEQHKKDDDYIEKHGLRPYIIMGIGLAILFHFVLLGIVLLVKHVAGV